jgi:hypothetical protein
MVNSSLTYEILMYLNSFYFGMFSICELGEFRIDFRWRVFADFSIFLGMGLLKYINLDYKDDVLVKEAIILVSICLLESIRVHLGRKGSLSDNGEFEAFEVLIAKTLQLKWVAIVENGICQHPHDSQFDKLCSSVLASDSVGHAELSTTNPLLPGYQVWLSVVLTVPVAIGVTFLLTSQWKIFKLEYMLCGLMLTLQTTEFVFAILFLISLCRTPTFE